MPYFTQLLKKIFVYCAAFTLFFASTLALAANTAAGTVITNSVTASYSVDSVVQPSITSNVAQFTVDELLDVLLTWQDGTPVSVNAPDVNNVITFLLTNSGNGQEAFSLVRNNNIAGDQYDPINGSAGSLFLENGLQSGFQASGPNADTPYVLNGNNPILGRDASLNVYVVSNTPNALSNGNLENVQLTAASTTAGAAGAALGTTLAGLGDGGIDAVVGVNKAQAQSVGSYIVGGVSLNVVKTATCSPAPSDCSKAAAGTIITYQLQINVGGVGTATNLVITDPLPANTNYLPNSMLVGTSAKTDAIDADNAQFSSNTITVNLGNTLAPATITIKFQATIQ